MKSNWKFILPLVLFAGVVVLFYQSLNRDKMTLPSPLIAKAAPQFTLPSLSDPAVKITNSDFAGKPYVVNVWGTWCPGCLQEHSVLQQIAARNEVPIVGINWNDDTARAALYLKKKGNPYAFPGFDPNGRIAIDWGVYGAPETFLVGADGKVLYKHISPMSLEVWEQEFLPRLGGSSAASKGGRE
jgi:cytochrome c biogenesis protein CcmG/thiol:disulfide interchange protein DsbE